jgi:YfiH family protein
MNALKSPLLSAIPGIVHGFGGKDVPLDPGLGDLLASGPRWKQVHGTGCGLASRPGQELGEIDALVSRTPGVPIAVQTADCVPILLARHDGGAVAAVHAGWRGTRARIVSALFRRLGQEGESPGDWVASVGPAIGPCCYEVSGELADEFAREFAAYGAGRVVPAPRRLDLPAINEAQLREAGVGQVEVLRHCTRCETGPDGSPRWRSYRREGPAAGARQWAGILIPYRT